MYWFQVVEACSITNRGHVLALEYVDKDSNWKIRIGDELHYTHQDKLYKLPIRGIDFPRWNQPPSVFSVMIDRQHFHKLEPKTMIGQLVELHPASQKTATISP